MNTGKSLMELVSKNLSQNSLLMESARRSQQALKRGFLTGPTKSAYKGNPWKHYILKYGDKPKYLQSVVGANTGTFVKVFLILVLPLVASPLYMDYWINKHREEGNPLLEEYEAQLRTKRARQKEGGEDVVLEAEEVLAHSVTSPQAAAAVKKDHYKYILVGGGTASHAAMKEILARDPEAEILIVTDDAHRPYERPPLSKEMWKERDESNIENLKFEDWRGKEASIFYEDEEFYKDNPKITMVNGMRVAKLDISKKHITTEDGTVYKFDKCLLATGGTPRVVPGYESFPDRVTTFRTVDDFKKLEHISRQGGNVVVVGGSFLGTELSYALAQRGKGTVTQVFLEPVPLARNLPRYLSKTIRSTLKDVGVQLKPNRNVTQIEQGPNGKLVVRLDSGEVIGADYVMTATGIFPNTELAEAAGLEIDPQNGGVMTNAELEARNGVYVAGDVLSYHDTSLGRRRVEHYDHATATGRHAGRNMASKSNRIVPFEYMSMFWSDVGNMHFEAVGEVNSSLNTYAVFDGVQIGQNGSPWSQAPAPMMNSGFQRGVVYYMRDNRIVGVLLWNLSPKALASAKKLVRQRQQYPDPTALSNAINVSNDRKE